ncbi:MAG TPA: AEC family transporter [Candidatus Merdenecus merdavium]|nr:AEC family transporter [Candidatus Merdenecus merdavium]
MSIQVVLHQMVIIFILMLLGYLVYKKGIINDVSTKHISGLIINLFNPALLISSSISENRQATTKDILITLLVAISMFVILMILGTIMPFILKAPKKNSYVYTLMTIFGNIGFMGIPITAALFGREAVIYVSVFNLPYNILIYTYGTHLIKKNSPNPIGSFHLKDIINIGTISSFIAIFLFLLNPPIPDVLRDTVEIVGGTTTCLSMMVVGVSLAKFPMKDIFNNGRIYLFTMLRLLLLPILAAIFLKGFFQNDVMFGVTILMLSMPAGSLPALLSEELGVDSTQLSRGILLTTILSLVTISMVCTML